MVTIVILAIAVVMSAIFVSMYIESSNVNAVKEALRNVEVSIDSDRFGTQYVSMRHKHGNHRVKISYQTWRRSSYAHIYRYISEMQREDTRRERGRQRDRRSSDYNYSSSSSSSNSSSVDAAFAFLGILKTRNQGAVTSAYRKLAKKFHPDTGGSAEQFQKLTKAYEVAKRYAENN